MKKTVSDRILFLMPLGRIYTLPGTCNLYYIENEHVFNNVEISHNDSESEFSVKGISLNEFITKYLIK